MLRDSVNFAYLNREEITERSTLYRYLVIEEKKEFLFITILYDLLAWEFN